MARKIPLSANRGRRGGNGGGRRRRNGWSCKWSDELKVKKDESAWIQLTKATYRAHGEDGEVPFFSAPMFKLQYPNRWGGTSYGYFRGNGGDDCTLQQLADSQDPNVQEPKYGEPNRFFVNVVHYALYHREPVVKNGETLTYSQGKLKGQPVYRWEEVKSVRDRKQLLKDPDSENLGFYRKKFLELPATQFRVVQEINRKARSMCKCGGALFPSVFICGNCEEVLLDVDDADMTDSEIANYGDQDIRCRHCGEVDFPQAEYDCDSCDNPRPHEYYEVAAKIKKVIGSTGYPTLALDTVIPLSDMVFENKAPVVEPDPDDPEKMVFTEEPLEKIAEAQFDFDEYTTPKTNAEYSDMLGLREGDIGYASSAKRYNKFR